MSWDFLPFLNFGSWENFDLKLIGPGPWNNNLEPPIKLRVVFSGEAFIGI